MLKNMLKILGVGILLLLILCAASELLYFSSKMIYESNTDIEEPRIIIPKISVNESINNESLENGVLIDPAGVVPPEDSVVLYGHRLMHGSPFLRLNELTAGDSLILNWNGTNLKYHVTGKDVVSETSDLEYNSTNELILVTCHPVGSTSERLIIRAELT